MVDPSHRPGWFDTTAVAPAPVSPLVICLVVGMLAPAAYALYAGAEALVVVSLLMLQLSGLLFAPAVALTEGLVSDFERWWLASRVRTAQQRGAMLLRHLIRFAARISLAVAAASCLLILVALGLRVPFLAWVGATGFGYTIVIAPLTLIISGFTSGRLLPAELRDAPDDPPLLLSETADALFSEARRPKTLLCALVLFMAGSALAVVSAAPGNAPF